MGLNFESTVLSQLNLIQEWMICRAETLKIFGLLLNIINISVACAIGPSVSKRIEDSTDFFGSKLNFCNLFELPATKFTQNQYLLHLSSENCEINFIKFNLLKALQ
jgi:hypothetical protein